jgi:hypothetical protein
MAQRHPAACTGAHGAAARLRPTPRRASPVETVAYAAQPRQQVGPTRPDPAQAACFAERTPNFAKWTRSPTCTILMSHEACIENPIKILFTFLTSFFSLSVRRSGAEDAAGTGRPPSIRLGGWPAPVKARHWGSGMPDTPATSMAMARGGLWHPGYARAHW